jgi:hypothetical protein
MKTTFAVGHCDRKTRNLVLIQGQASPIAGPFVLKVLVTR